MRSIFDSQKLVDKNQWLVAIFRKPYGKNPEHAFLVVEGVHEDGNHVLRRYDLFQDQKNPDKALIRIIPTPPKTYSGNEASLQSVFKREFLRFDEVCGNAWNIPREKAEALDRGVISDQSKDILYHSSGRHGLVSVSGDFESCYSWACSKLIGLHIPSIKIDPQTLLERLTAERASIHLRTEDPEEEKYSHSRTRCSMQ
jgi:hypothetical protein